MPHDPVDQPAPNLPVVALIPVFNDWAAVSAVLEELDGAVKDQEAPIEVLLIDDGSLIPHEEAFRPPALDNVRALQVLELRRNLGHQRAIAVGLAYVQERVPARAVVVMDGDGEDDPADVPRLLEACRATGWTRLVFAARSRRSEGLRFTLCYRIYQFLHWLLTGYRVRVGNFSVIPAKTLARLVVVSELWNHYAAAVFNARMEYIAIAAVRRPRLAGKSQMNFTALVVHGLSALSVYSQVIGVRLLIAALALAAALATALAGAAWYRNEPSGEGASFLLVLIVALLVLLLQAISSGMVFVLLVLAGRQNASFIPLRDYRWFVGRTVTLKGPIAQDR